MMLKIVYGPPPADMERIDAVEPDGDNEIREDEVAKTSQSVVTAKIKS